MRDIFLQNSYQNNTMKTLLTLIGLVMVLEGLPYAAFPEKMQDWLRELIQMRPSLLRVIGLLAIGCGLFLCYLTQRTDLF